jgi:hypothetical protein
MRRQIIFKLGDELPRAYDNTKLVDFIAELQKVLEQTPAALRGEVQIAFDTSTYYDNTEPTVEITLQRDATPEEAEADRLAQKKRLEADARRYEQAAEQARRQAKTYDA